MANINIIGYYPDSEASGVPTNATIWVQFDRKVNWDSVMAPYWMSVSELDGSDVTAVEGELSISTDKMVITFTPNTLLKPNQKYLIYVFGGSSGVSAGEGTTLAYLDDSFSWDFVTGAETDETGESIQNPSGVPEASGVPDLIYQNLKVLKTVPIDGAYNQDLDLSSVRIEFNDVPVLPSGKTWFDMIDVSRQGVLG